MPAMADKAYCANHHYGEKTQMLCIKMSCVKPAISGYKYCADHLTGRAEIDESILQEAYRLIHGERANEYGPPSKNFADVARGWSEILGHTVEADQVALCMIWLKICRYQNGKSRDSLVDIAGYAGTIEMLRDNASA